MSQAVGASKLSYWEVAKHATAQYAENYETLKTSCDLASSKKASWEDQAKGLDRKTAVIGKQAHISEAEYNKECAVYTSLEKAHTKAIEVLNVLANAIAECTRPPLSANTYETLRGLERDIEELKGDENALKLKVEDLRKKHADVEVLCDRFKERLPKAKTPLDALYYYQEGKRSRVVEAAAAVGTALTSGLAWAFGSNGSSEPKADPASNQNSAKPLDQSNSDDLSQPGLDRSASLSSSSTIQRDSAIPSGHRQKPKPPAGRPNKTYTGAASGQGGAPI